MKLRQHSFNEKESEIRRILPSKTGDALHRSARSRGRMSSYPLEIASEHVGRDVQPVELEALAQVVRVAEKLARVLVRVVKRCDFRAL